MKKNLRIALVSTGLGRILRGFESFTESLFKGLKEYAPEVDVALFQGGGKSGERRYVVPNFHRSDVPARWFGKEKSNLLENRSFAISLYPLLRRGKFSIVHYNELVMGSALFHLRRIFGGDFKLLYCNGAPSPPVHYYHRCDFAQVLTGPMYEEAKAFGIENRKVFLVPYGVDAERFSPNKKVYRSQVRKELGISESSKVILTVGALKREHKRIDHVIKEVAPLGDNVWLIASGQRTKDTYMLEREAEKHIPGRWRFVSWAHERMPFLYGATDVFVLASLSEGFGLVTIESMLSGLRTIIHENEVNKWIADGTSARLINMSADGELKKTLQQVLYSENEESFSERSKERFSWQRLIPSYVEMYKLSLAINNNGVTHGQ